MISAVGQRRRSIDQYLRCATDASMTRGSGPTVMTLRGRDFIRTGPGPTGIASLIARLVEHRLKAEWRPSWNDRPEGDDAREGIERDTCGHLAATGGNKEHVLRLQRDVGTLRFQDAIERDRDLLPWALTCRSEDDGVAGGCRGDGPPTKRERSKDSEWLVAWHRKRASLRHSANDVHHGRFEDLHHVTGVNRHVQSRVR